MKLIGNFHSRKVFWFDYKRFDLEKLPSNDWISFTISAAEPDFEKFKVFAKNSIDFGILEFKSQGEFGEEIHLLFDEIMVEMEISDQIPFIDIATTGDSDESLMDAFWECFFATTLPNRTNFENLSIVCMDLNGKDRSDELVGLLAKFEAGWFPEDSTI